MFTALSKLRSPRLLLAAALLALTGGASAPSVWAASTTIQTPHDIGLGHTQVSPYNFVGRLFSLDDASFGSFGTGTLVRRHTVLTAGHVVYSPSTGFIANAIFTRALYKTFSLSRNQVIKVTALAGYQTVAYPAETITNAGAQLDQAYVLLREAPVDENWANIFVQPSLLNSNASFFLVLGYSIVSLDGQTLGYVVPTASYTPLGASTSTAVYINSSYIAESGMSGGPIYYIQYANVASAADQYVVGTTIGGTSDKTGVATVSYVRAIDQVANKTLIDAEYSAGLIKKVKVTGPTTVARGQTYTYNTKVVFSTPTASGVPATTNRYGEIKLKNTVTDSATNPAVVIKKTSNTTFNVTFTAAARPGTVVTLQAVYNKTSTPLGKSSVTVLIQ